MKELWAEMEEVRMEFDLDKTLHSGTLRSRLEMAGFDLSWIDSYFQGTYCFPDLDEHLVTEHPRETDKPEGTRDVDKFLREQQNRIWRSGG